MNGNLNGLARSHHELVDTIVQRFFQKDVNAIIGGRSIPQFTDIHSRTQSYVLLPIERADVVFGILVAV